MRQEYAWRSMALTTLLAFVAVAVLGQMIRIQHSTEAEVFRVQAEKYSGKWQTFYPERGEVYDRNGHLLAGNEAVYTVGVNIPDMEDAHTIALT